MLINSKTHLVSKNYDRKCLTEFLDSKKLGPTKIATVTDLHFPLFLSFSLIFLYSSLYLHTALSLSHMSLSLHVTFFLSFSFSCPECVGLGPFVGWRIARFVQETLV